MLDEKFQQNTSKFAIHINENSKLLFPFQVYFFLHNECPGLWSRVYIREKWGSSTKCKTEKIFLRSFACTKFQWNFSSSTNLKIGRSNTYVCEASSKHISKKQRKYDAYQFWCQDTSILTITFLNAIKTRSWILSMHEYCIEFEYCFLSPP